MNAQQIIDTCDTREFNREQFRKEMNLSFLINDAKKQFMIFGNEEGGASSSSECPALPNQITEKGVSNAIRKTSS